MSRDTLNAARGSVVLAVLMGAFALFQLWRALDVGGEKWIDAVLWAVLALMQAALARWIFRRARRNT